MLSDSTMCQQLQCTGALFRSCSQDTSPPLVLTWERDYTRQLQYVYFCVVSDLILFQILAPIISDSPQPFTLAATTVSTRPPPMVDPRPPHWAQEPPQPRMVPQPQRHPQLQPQLQPQPQPQAQLQPQAQPPQVKHCLGWGVLV